jgi:hypothetical protein
MALVVGPACSEQPTAPEIRGISLSGGKPVQVRDTDPPAAEQGTIDLRVRVLGSGFEAPARVRLLMDGSPTGIVASEVAEFVSDKELVTTITVEEDAAVGLWDVEVELLAKGRKGIGIELFEVQTKCLDPEFCNPGIPGVGKGGTETPISLAGSYSTISDQGVGEKRKGQEWTFQAKGEHKIEYTLDLPAYAGDAVCVGNDELVETREAFWNDFLAEQNDATMRSYLLNFRTDGKNEANRTEMAWPHPDGSVRIVKAGTTGDFGLDVNATVEHTVDVDGNDVYTLTGGSLQFRYLSGGAVTCPNTGTFVLTAKR